MSEPKRIPVDWRTVRAVLCAVKPDWKPSTNNEPNQDYDFARDIIEAYAGTRLAKCRGCGVERDPFGFYRCWDCHAYLCENCIKGHMGAQHVPHRNSDASEVRSTEGK